MVFFILKKQIVFYVFHTIETEGIKKMCFTFFSDYGQIRDARSVNHIIRKVWPYADLPDLDQL